ncbi:MAG: ATP-binding protein [Eubacteriales bacterium]|nr:ATP-binding protein [Eubacteriales bacterium]
MADRLEQLYKSIRDKNTQTLLEHREDAYRRSPRFAQIDSERAKILFSGLTPEAAKMRLDELRSEQELLLKELYLPPTYLDMRYQCPACKDTGFVGEDIRKPCACYLKNKQRFLMEGARINDVQTFERFSTDIYSNDLQRTRTNNAKKICEAYANGLPTPKSCSLLMLGEAGLGKSYLGNAIAYRAIENGIECIRITAYRFIQDIMEGLSLHENRLNKYIHVPLLVLDDLGIEPIISNVTGECLLSLISERQGARMATVCISNLSYEEMYSRYTERFASRLFDNSTTILIQLTGNDLRGSMR